jgi:hypothetical protein
MEREFGRGEQRRTSRISKWNRLAAPLSIFSFPFSVSPKGGNMATSKTTIGYAVQLGGIAAFTIGGILSLHHVAIGASFLGGAAAFYVGQKIRALA